MSEPGVFTGLNRQLSDCESDTAALLLFISFPAEPDAAVFLLFTFFPEPDDAEAAAAGVLQLPRHGVNP
jgi:hypothetical protein